MRLLDAHSKLLGLGQSVFLTTDAAACLEITNSHANKVLTRLAEGSHVIRLSRGRWAIPTRLDVLTLPEHLTAPFPSYVSLQSALYYHGMIEQIPAITYAVSLARTKRITTPMGVISIHHVQPTFFFGFEIQSDTGIKLATPEKALIDILYLSPAKSRLFRRLPELELPKKFNIREARNIVRRIESERRRSLVIKRFEDLVKQR